MRLVVVAVVVALTAVACSGDDSDGGGGLPSVGGEQSDSDSGGGGDPGDGNGLPSCDELYAVGTPVAEILDAGGCNDGESIRSIDLAIDDCLDGRQLVWNDTGWGYSDGSWTAHAAGASDAPAAEQAACSTG